MIPGSRVYRLSVNFKFDESGIGYRQGVSHTNPVNESACRPPFPAARHVLTAKCYPAW